MTLTVVTGFTVIVNVSAIPKQPFNSGVTINESITMAAAAPLIFDVSNGNISPVSDTGRLGFPIDTSSFVQIKLVESSNNPSKSTKTVESFEQYM